MTLEKNPFENIVGKGENADNQHFLLFPQHFLSSEGKPLSLTHYQMTHFRLFQTERVCRQQNFKFDENGRKLSKGVKNTVGKGEIACYEQFLVLPQCF